MFDLENKRKRFPNFSIHEEDTFLKIIEKHKNVLENRATNTDAWQQKKRAWEQISEDYQRQTGVKRPAKNLKDKYENMKKKLRREQQNGTHSSVKRDGEEGVGGGHFSQSDASRLSCELEADYESSNSFYTNELEDIKPDIGAITFNEYNANEKSYDWPTSESKRQTGLNGTETREEQAAKSELQNVQTIFYQNEERRAQEKHDAEMKIMAVKLKIMETELKIKQKQLENT